MKAVEQITFNGDVALANKQQVTYITERCVFLLKEDGLHLSEIAPGIDLQTQILDVMDFAPIIDRDANGQIKLMDAALFAEGLMGLKEMKS
ncbi:Acetate CoA-transferase YdiF [bioreactor metagenome]|uniref:Acetate CoA-transferase YdiF n=1 Tax=bioreactor metagenome TaxID=1076179 RepID=A0A645JLG7_9ZZZZ